MTVSNRIISHRSTEQARENSGQTSAFYMQLIGMVHSLQGNNFWRNDKDVWIAIVRTSEENDAAGLR